MVISKQVAAIASFILGIVLIAAKVIIGVTTGSLAILAESIDGMLDVLATAMAFLAVHIADLPPDDNHPYGHARADNLGALAQAVLLVVTAVWIWWQALERLLWQPEEPVVTLWSFLVIILSLVLNGFRVWALNRATAQSSSQTLAANIANFANDMLGSLAVLLALVLVALQSYLPLPSWLIVRADALAAAFVASLGLYLAWNLGGQSIRALMDDVPPDLNRRLVSRVQAVPDVVANSTSVRTRFVGEQPYVEVTVGTPRDRSLEEAHQLADDIEHAVRLELDRASVLVHVEPARMTAEPYATTVYSIAQRLGLRVHNLDLYQVADGVGIEMDLEVPAELTLAEAHRHSEDLEAAISAELNCCSSVSVHLEPRRDMIQPAVRYDPVRQKVLQALKSLPENDQHAIWHIETLLTDVGVIVTLRCQFPGDILLTEVHTKMTRIEQNVRHAIPEVVRVQIDPEPVELLGLAR